MLEIASQIIICLILAALLGLIIGYLMGKATCKKENKQTEEVNHSHGLNASNQNHKSTATVIPNNDVSTETVDVGTKPLLLSEAREGGKDNLQLIKGVGPVLEGVLNETGIYHFDQIANLSSSEIQWLDKSIDFPGRIERENWISQAKDLAAGNETEYSQRVESGEVSSSKKPE